MFVLSSCVAKSQRSNLTMYTKEDILTDLENLHPYKSLPNFGLSSETLAGSRITLFADSTRWAVVFETVEPGQYGELILYYFGNCLINQEKGGLYGQYLSNTSFLRLITSEEYASIVAGEDIGSGLIAKDAKQVRVREQYLPIEQDKNEYAMRGIPLNDYLDTVEQIDYPAMLRYLAEKHSDLFRATDEELRTLLPKDLPKLFVIDKWHHQDYYVFPDGVNSPFGKKPSSYETYPMIAEILVTKDLSKWRPTLAPNNDWRNWRRQDD